MNRKCMCLIHVQELHVRVLYAPARVQSIIHEAIHPMRYINIILAAAIGQT